MDWAGWNLAKGTQAGSVLGEGFLVGPAEGLGQVLNFKSPTLLGLLSRREKRLLTVTFLSYVDWGTLLVYARCCCLICNGKTFFI